MEIDADVCFKVLEKSFNFEIVDTCIGRAIKMCWLDAFLFANVTGAVYLDDPTYPFTPKGVLKVLREAFNYNLVTGIFDRHRLFYSPYEMSKFKDYLFEGDKYVIPLICNSEEDYTRQLIRLQQIIENNSLRTTDYIFLRIEAWKNGNGMESFLEYITCEVFKKQGYIVENQIPLVATVGSPDFGGFKLSKMENGFHIVELALLRLTKNSKLIENLDIDHVIVGEAKTATTIMASQLEKYLNTTAFKMGFEMHPDKPKPTKPCFGLLNICSSGEVRCKYPEEQYVEKGSIIFDFKEYMTWYKDLLKFYLLANLTNDELELFINLIIPKGKYNQAKLINAIKQISIDSVANKIREVI